MRLLSLLSVLIILVACNSGDSAIQNIANLEKSLAGDASKRGELVAAYETYINENQEDSNKTPEYLLKAAKLALEDNRVQQLIPMLVTLQRKFPNNQNAKEGFGMLADLYAGKLNLPALAKPIYSKLLADDAGNKTASDYVANNADVPELATYLDGLKTSFIDTTSGNVNRTAIRDYQRGVSVLGLTSAAADKIDWLLSGGETARMVKNNQGAIDFYNWVLEEFPNDPKSSQALFLKAFTYDNELNQDDIAKPLYESFLAKYPDNDFADDAKFLLQNLGKSDEEIIQSFQKPEEGDTK